MKYTITAQANGQVGDSLPSPNTSVQPVQPIQQQPVQQQQPAMGGSPGGVASNPASGVNNIQLNQAAPTATGGASPEQIRSLMDMVISTKPGDSKYESLQTELAGMLKQVHTKDVQNKLSILIDAMSHNSKIVTPGMKTPKDLANEIKEMVHHMTNIKKQQQHTQTASIRVSAPKGGGEGGGKKKTRGNPFRVLMGQVGKLLDHGVKKNEIIKYLGKKKFWSKEMIQKAVDIVKDYNRKKRSNGDDDDDKSAKASSYNYMSRFSAREPESIYDIQRDFHKASTAELSARAKWLRSVRDYGPSDYQYDGRKTEDKSNVVSQIRAIKTALADRGFKDDELEDLM